MNSPSTAASRFTVLARGLLHLPLRALMRVVLRVRVEHPEHLESKEPFLLVANHNSHLDTPMLFQGLAWSRVGRLRPVAALDYFERHPLARVFAEALFRPIWIERDAGGGHAVERVVEALDRGDSVLLYPEGSRGVPGALAPFRRGVGRVLRLRPGIPVVPAWVEGTARSLPRGACLPRLLPHRVRLAAPRLVRGTSEEIARALRDAVAGLGSAAATGAAPLPSVPRPVTRIALVGIDGCGKSTVSRRLARELSAHSRTCLIGDRVEFYRHRREVSVAPPWPEALRRLAGSLAKRAHSLAAYKVPKLAELLLRDAVAARVERRALAEIIVMDGAPVINLLAWAVLYRERDIDQSACTQGLAALTAGAAGTPIDAAVRARFPELALMARLRLNRLRLPDAALLLDLDPGAAVRRIRARNEPLQVHENERSLARLRAAYLTVERLLEGRPGVLARRLDAALAPEALAAQTLRVLHDRRCCHA